MQGKNLVMVRTKHAAQLVSHAILGATLAYINGVAIQTSQIQNIVSWIRHPLDDQLRANILNQKLRSIPVRMIFNDPDLNLRAEEAYAVLAEKMDAIRGMFAKTNEQVGMDLSAYDTQAHRLIIPAVNYVLSLKDGKKRFLDLVLAINKAFSLCSTLDEAKNLHKEIALYSAIKAVISKHTSVDRKAALGLNPDEIAFYDALANNESAVRELGDDTLKQIAREITEKLRKSTTVDWQVRDSVRAQLKILVRRTLQRWKYPPDKAAEAIELVMKQAEQLSNAWTTS